MVEIYIMSRRSKVASILLTKRQKDNFAFLESTSHHPSSLLERDAQRKMSPLIKLWRSFPKIGKPTLCIFLSNTSLAEEILSTLSRNLELVQYWVSAKPSLHSCRWLRGVVVGGEGGAGAQEIKGFWCIQHQHFSQTGLNSASCRSSKQIKHLLKTQWLRQKMWLLQWSLIAEIF